MGNPRLQLTSLFLALLGAAFLPGHEAFRSMKFTTFDSPTTPSPPPSPSLPPPSPHSPPPPTHHDPPPGSPPPASASPPPPASPPAPASPSPPPLARHDSPPSVVHRKSPPPPESSPPPPPAPDAEITPTPVVHREPPPPPPTKQSHPPPPAALSPPPPIHSANVPHHAASERKLLEDGSYSFHVGSEPESSSNSHHDQSQLPTNDETSPTANHAAVDTIFDNELPHQVSDSPLEGDHHPMSHLQSEKKLSGEEQFPVPNSGSTRKCGISDPPAPTPAIAPVSGGPVSVPSPYGGYAPVGSPFYQPGDPGSPSPAPAPTAGSDEGRQPYYNSPSPPSSNSTVAHTTTVSAMKVGLVLLYLSILHGNANFHLILGLHSQDFFCYI